MSSESRPGLRRCTCNYKCKHTPLGVEYVSDRVYYLHCHQDALGKVHPSVRRDMEEATETLQTPRPRQFTTNAQWQTRKVTCNCKSYCAGGRLVHPATFARHKLFQTRYNNIITRWGFPIEANANTRTSMSQDDNNIVYDEVLHEDTTIEDVSHETPQCYMEEPQDLSLEDQIIERCIEMQALWDKYQTPIQLQDEMLRLLFGDMAGSKDAPSANVKTKPSLGKLLVQLPTTWNGDLNGIKIPTCWKQLINTYVGLGMHDVQRFRMCTGVGSSPHSARVFQPSKEDNYAGDVLYCLCQEDSRKKRFLKRDCVSCCEKCMECKMPRKDMVAFEYAPISTQLQFLSKSRTICHKFLRMWRNKERWLGKHQMEHPDHINEFWDGKKCRETQTFWNPNSSFELPVICEQSFCKKAYTTFPNRCQLLQNNWDEDRGIYDFICTACRSPIQCKRKLCKVF